MTYARIRVFCSNSASSNISMLGKKVTVVPVRYNMR